jgi:hypothetical protein
VAQFVAHPYEISSFCPGFFLTAMLALAGSRPDLADLAVSPPPEKTPTKYDDCQMAARHLEFNDIPQTNILQSFQQLEQKGDVRGTMWIARCYLLGRLTLPERPDLAQQMAKKAFPAVLKLAKHGDTESQFLVGGAYHLGLGVDQDFPVALNWYYKAAHGGHITALNNLGVMLARGYGTDPDIVLARRLFFRAANLGSGLAFTNLTFYGDDDRDDSARLNELRAIPLVQALGMKKDKGIAFLVAHGIITDPTPAQAPDMNGLKQFPFPANGITLSVDASGRITQVELVGHARGSRGSSHFRRELAL